jgi:iron(III) transport system substrate-binding protein
LEKGRSAVRVIGFAWIMVITSGLLSASLTAAAADQALIDAAKKEGSVTWYTTQIVNQVARPAADAFQKRYGIQVNFVRGDSAEVALRVLNEQQAGHPLADVIDGTTTIPTVKARGLLMKWLPERITRMPKEAHDQEGYWVATNEDLHTPAFNTNLIPRGTEPKTYQDLLDPKWKGQMAWASHPSTSGAAGFVGMVLNTMGDEEGMSYLRNLAKQKMNALSGSSRSVVDQIVQGEYALAIQVFNHQAVFSAARGAPVDWIPISPAMGIFDVTALMKEAPHPNAAKLFESFLISDAGQRIFRDGDYIPVDPNVLPRVPSLRPNGSSFQATFFSPEQISESLPHWAATYKSIFE